MTQASKRARTVTHDDELGGEAQEASSSLLTELLARVSQLEESQGQVTELQTRVTTLEVRVTELEGELIRAEDRDFDVGRSVSKTAQAVRNGQTSILAERLHKGADPNHDDGLGGTLLIHSANGGRPECTRLLIEHGADVSYCFPADNSSVLYMLVSGFESRSEYTYRPGDFILSADLLVDAGAPIDVICERATRRGEPNTALNFLRSVEVREGSRCYREHRGLMAVLERQYWRGFAQNPFVGASPDAAAWLLIKGAADNEATGHVDITRVRSIKPDLRNDVVNALTQYQGMRETFVHIILTMKDANSVSPFCALHGHESTILPVIAAYAGSSGWSLRKLQEAKKFLQDAIQRFNVDGGSDDGLYGEFDDDGDDDSYEVDDDDGDDDGSGDELVDSDEGDY